jgi:hypothetical protein
MQRARRALLRGRVAVDSQIQGFPDVLFTQKMHWIECSAHTSALSKLKRELHM